MTASRSTSIQAVRRSGGRPAAARRASIGRAVARRGQVRGSDRSAGSRSPASPASRPRRPRILGRRDRIGRFVGPRRRSVPGQEAEAQAAAARPPLRDRGEPLAGHRDRLGQVRGEEARVAEPLPDAVAGEAVEVDAEPGRVVGREVLGEERPDRPAQDVAGAAARERGVLERGDRQPAVRRRDHGPRPLEDDHLVPRRRPRPGRPSPGPGRHRSGRRPSSGSWPLPARSRANSPECGVRTDGRRSPSHQCSSVASERSASASSTAGGAAVVAGGEEQPDELRGRRGRAAGPAR